MADGEHDKESENPFSFKKFVHTKKPDTRQVKSDKRRKEKVTQEGATSNSKAKKDNFVHDVPFPDVAEVASDPRKAESEASDAKEDSNPFSFKSFMAQDVASKKKRVLQIIDDEVHEMKLPPDNSNGEYTRDQTHSESLMESSDSENEDDGQHTARDSPRSGSVHYFVAPPESSDGQAFVIEELNKLREENDRLKNKLQRSHETKEENKRKVTSLQKKLAMIEKREADETAALENMVQMVERNLELTTQRALRAETSERKLREELKALKSHSVSVDTYNDLLEAHISTLRVVKEKSRSAAEQMATAAKNAEHSIKQMLSGVDTLKFVSNQLESIDRITEVPPSKHDS